MERSWDGSEAEYRRLATSRREETPGFLLGDSRWRTSLDIPQMGTFPYPRRSPLTTRTEEEVTRRRALRPSASFHASASSLGPPSHIVWGAGTETVGLRSLGGGGPLPPRRIKKTYPLFSILSPELNCNRKKLASNIFWVYSHTGFLLASLLIWYAIQDTDKDSFGYNAMCIIISLYFLAGASFNFCMSIVLHKKCKRLADAIESKEETTSDSLFTSIGKKLRSSLLKKRILGGSGSGGGQSEPEDADFRRFRLPREPSLYPWQEVLHHQTFFVSNTSQDTSKDGGDWPSSDRTLFGESSSDSNRQVLKEMKPACPKVYPMFERRKDNYLISDQKEARKLMKDFRKALDDEEVSYCFHPGQSEKYMKYLPVPKDSGYRDFKDMCHKLVYQTSPLKETNNPSSDDPHVLPIHSEVWRKFKINPKTFVNWVANLRVWIAKTIIHQIVDEIDAINSKLKTVAPSISIGNVGLEELISCSRNSVIRVSVPSFAVLLPYLQISTNQKYIVQRLRDLARGNTMNDFCWKSGGKIDDKAWEPHLPSDAELIVHLLVTYFDSLMPISIECPNRKPFTSNYFARHPDPPPPHTDIVIYQQHTAPPHYKLIIQNETCSMPSGAYNMFFTILLFLHHIKTKHDGFVGRLFLGRRGVNILSIIEDI